MKEMKANGWNLECKMGAVEDGIIEVIQGGVKHRIEEPFQPVEMILTTPAGKTIKKRVELLTLCHGENPEIIFRQITSGWGTELKDWENGVEIYFPDGSLYVNEAGDEIWED
jgi:hypothetical protein